MAQASAVFNTTAVKGEILFHQRKNGVLIEGTFSKLPAGKHGFHIHKAGDLRGDGCKLACDHWHKGGPTTHGGPPTSKEARHTGDLGNLEMKGSTLEVEHFLRKVTVDELFGRSLIVHADEDDYGKGDHEDSKTTGHSGARIACAVIGRTLEGCKASSTRKNKNRK